jgi:hypothetical protein
VRFPDKSLPKEVLNTLIEAGYIEATKTTTGRGAKPFLVKPTDKVRAEILASPAACRCDTSRAEG